MTHDFYNENLDAYLKSELSAQEKVVFEQFIEQDPVLKSDFLLQKEIFDAICQRRKQVLKARLDKVEMDEVPFYYNLPRTAMVGTLATAILLTGVLVFFDNTKENGQTNEHLAKAPQEQKNKNAKQTSKLIELKDPQKAEAESPQVNTQALLTNHQPYTIARVQNRNRVVINRLATLSEKNRVPLATTQKITLQDFNKQANEISKPHLVLAHKQDTQIAYQLKDTDSDLSVFDGKNEPSLESISEKNKLSYQHYNEKLFLYNSNSRGKEIKLVANGMTRHFLFYENEFYEFNENQFDKSELFLVQSQELIEELKKYLNK
jgi:hypothetical protein